MRRIPPEFLAYLHGRLKEEGPGDRLLAETGTTRLTGRANSVPLWYHRRVPPAPGQDTKVQAVELSLRTKGWRACWYWESCGGPCTYCTFSAAAVVLGPKNGLFLRELEVTQTADGWTFAVPMDSGPMTFDLASQVA